MLEYLKQTVHAAAERLKKVPAAPRAVAGGVALGMFWSFTPLLGLKNVLSISSAWVCRCSKLAAVLTVSAHDIITPLWPFILRWEYDLGFWFLHHHFPHRLSGDLLHLKNWFNADLLKILWPTFLGSLLFAVPSALISYWIVDRSLHRYHLKHRAAEPPLEGAAPSAPTLQAEKSNP